MGMTNSQLHQYFLTKAEQAETRARRRYEAIIEADRHVLTLRWKAQRRFWEDRDFELELEVIASKSRSNDPVWKAAAADSQWMMQKAVMYGTAANNELLTQLLIAMRSNG